MEVAVAGLVGLFFATAFYLIMSRMLIRVLLGVAILGNAVNMLIFTSGRLSREVPPVIPATAAVPELATANPLPQALILTAIVISFAFFSFLLVLTYRAYQELDTDDSEAMRFAEPADDLPPPTSY